MDSLKNQLVMNALLEDINRYFRKFLSKLDPKDLNMIWQNLHHAKQEGWFNNEFYLYWLVKCINIHEGQGSYILCLPSITKKICGLNERQLGDFLMPRIDFITDLNDFSKALSLINYALQGSAVFEKAWLVNKLSYIGIEDKSNLININNQNEAIFLSNSL